MASPCGHSPKIPDSCRLCWLYDNQPEYRLLWDGLPQPLRPVVSLDCVHAGRMVQRDDGREWRRCDAGRGEVCKCQCNRSKCPDWDNGERVIMDTSDAPIEVRHLAYIVMPVSFNGTWQRNLDQLKTRMRLFNGRKMIAIMARTSETTQPLDHPDQVREYLDGTGCEFIEVSNNPTLREVNAWNPLIEAIDHVARGKREALFFAHAKGVTRPFDAGVSVHPWATLMYMSCLDHWPLVEEILKRKPIAGSFKKMGHGFDGSASSWHYSGTYYWIRTDAIFSKNWRQIDWTWWGTESWPGCHFHHDEAGCIFHEGPVYATERDAALNLYDFGYLTWVMEEFRRWTQQRR